MHDTWQDLRFGLRALGRRPGSTLVAGLTLAIGVGANTTMFSVLDHVLLKPLEYPDGERLVQVWGGQALTKSTLVQIQEHVPSFSAVSGYVQERVALTGDGPAEEIPAAAVSPSYFSVVGIQPALGRGFTQEESEPGRDGETILSDELWRARFAASPDILGRSILLDGRPHTVVGVMPAGYRPVVEDWKAWVPLTIDPADFSDYVATAGTVVLARLTPGATLAQARVELEPIARALQREAPQVFDDDFVARAVATPLLEARVGAVRSTLWLLLGAVGLVLLIACANVANLLLAQGGSRAREMSIRQSQGASRARLIRQLLTENTLLGLLGGGVGVLVSLALLRVLRTSLQGGIPRGDTVGVDYRVLLFALGTSFVTAIVFGLLPAVRAADTDVVTSLREGGQRGGAPRRRQRMNQALVGLEVAVSVVLLAGAGLVLKSSWLLQRVDPGFRTQDVLTMRLNLPEGRYSDPESRARYFTTVEERVAALPGVLSVGSISFLPMTSSHISTMYEVEGRPLPEGARQPFAMAELVTPGIRETLDLPLVRGRWFDDSDTPDAPLVGVINEAMAREAFDGEDPLGREMKMFGHLSFRVVGVVGDMRQINPRRAALGEAYLSFLQVPQMTSQYVAIRTAGPPSKSAAGVRAAIALVDPDVPISRVATMGDVIRSVTADSRLTTLLFSLFAGLALLLGIVGVYGVTAYAVSERIYEIGVRVALGARGGTVVGEAVTRAMIPVGVGLVVGLGAAFAGTRLMASLLFEVRPADPFVLVVASATLGVSALFASLLPARRAASVDPLRCMNS